MDYMVGKPCRRVPDFHFMVRREWVKLDGSGGRQPLDLGHDAVKLLDDAA